MSSIIRTSDDLAPDHWMARQLPPATSLRPYAEDHAVSTLTSVAIEAVANAGITRAEVARLMGVTRAHISHVLNGRTNMTLKTFGAILWACGQEVAALQIAPVGSPSPELCKAEKAWTRLNEAVDNDPA